MFLSQSKGLHFTAIKTVGKVIVLWKLLFSIWKTDEMITVFEHNNTMHFKSYSANFVINVISDLWVIEF